MKIILHTVTQKANIRSKKGVLHFRREIFKDRIGKLLTETRSYFQTKLIRLLIFLLFSTVWNQITF